MRVFSILLHFFLLKYAPLRNQIYLEIPEPSQISRESDSYEFESFGAPIEVGFSRRDITPKGFSWLAGYFPPHFKVAVHDPIWVKSLALRDINGNGLVIVSCDLIGLLPDEIENIKDLVKKVGRESIFISATHTHSGPDVVGLWGIPPVSGKNKKYMKFMREEIAGAIDESVDNVGPGKIRFGKGTFEGYSHGRVSNDPDFGVSVMQVLRKNGRPVTLVNFAVHPDIIKSFTMSADFPYYLEERLNKFSGGDTMFIPGAIGGVQPHRGDGSFVQARNLGEALADKVYEIMKKPITYKKVLLSGRTLYLNTCVENKFFLRAAELGMISKFFKEEDANIRVTANGSEIKINNKRIHPGFSMLRIGPAQIITVPGELFPNIWGKFKPMMDGDPKFIFGLTNGELGYILTQEDFNSGQHKYHAGMSIDSGFGNGVDMILNALLKK